MAKGSTRAEVITSVRESAKNTTYAGHALSPVSSDGTFVDMDNPRIKEDILRMVAQYLQDEGFEVSALTLQDEANVKYSEQHTKSSRLRGVKTAILEGDWNDVEKMCTRKDFQNHKSFLYAVYKQQYLEMIDRQEYQKAFAYLNRKLKPLESQQARPEEMKDLAYLLTAKSISEVMEWDGVISAREKLAQQFAALAELDAPRTGVEYHDGGAQDHVPPGRLRALLQQAVAFQRSRSHYQPRHKTPIKTLLSDYHCFVLPNSLLCTLRGHSDNVKSVCFIGKDGARVASGSSDNTIRLWQTPSPETAEDLASAPRCERLTGHASRIWQLACDRDGGLVASASADQTVKVWDAREGCGDCVATLAGHNRDVYSVAFHSGAQYLVSAGYDKTARLWDTERQEEKKTFWGHDSSVSSAIFNPHGNLIITGSKDNTIRFWDLISGLCVHTLSGPAMGEVTSVDVSSDGLYLLSCCKGNSNRLWDLRMSKMLRRFRGHQNTAKNFVRARFGPSDEMVMSGSEDGYLYVWDKDSGTLIQCLGHGDCGVIYEAVWNSEQAVLASCSHDHAVQFWWFDDTKPVEFDDGGR